jgi:hypothetical protein
MCVFLGYSHEHKGYRCLELSSCKIITSRHVLFDEFFFPFAHNAVSPSPPHTAAPVANPTASALDLVSLRAGSKGSSVPHPSWDLPDSSVMETREGSNPNLSVETDDNSIGEESRCSWPNYNYPEMLHLSNQYTNSRG